MINETKLRELAKERLEQHVADDFFDYHNWDDLIECEETIAGDDLDWMRENVKFKIEVAPEEVKNEPKYYHYREAEPPCYFVVVYEYEGYPRKELGRFIEMQYADLFIKALKEEK